MRGGLDSTRPRSYSSPYRDQHPHVTARTSRAEASDVDRILEALIYVQDINRRLGLETGRPASPSIFQSTCAAQLLRSKVQEELNIMARFSQSRADVVAHHLGIFPDPMVDRRFSGGEDRTRTAAVSSGQAGHLSRPLDISVERPPSSIDRLTLEDRHHRSTEHDRRAAAADTYREGGNSFHRYDDRAPTTYPSRADALLRAISRSSSFEQPRIVHHRTQPHSDLENGSAYPDYMGINDRFPHDYSMRDSFRAPGRPPVLLPANRYQQQPDLLDHRRLASKGMKRVKKRKNEHHQECLGCQAKETPEWRKGPMGPRTLCNACGLLYAKLTKRKQQEAEAAAKASGRTAEEIVREREESPGAKQASLEALRAELNLANGMRNRAMSTSSSSTPFNNSSMAPSSQTEVASTHPTRYHDMPNSNASSKQPWPAQHRDFSQPFAHQVSHHRPVVPEVGGPASATLHDDSRAMEGTSRPYTGSSIPAATQHRYPDETRLRAAAGRSNSLGYVDNVEQFADHHGSNFSSAADFARAHSRQGPLRPYSRGASPESYSSSAQIGRQRSASTLHASTVPSFASHYDRPESPTSSFPPLNASSGSNAQRRHHPYM